MPHSAPLSNGNPTRLQVKSEAFMWLVYGMFLFIVLSLFFSMLAHPPRTRL